MPDPEDARLRARLAWVTVVAVLSAVSVAALGLAQVSFFDQTETRTVSLDPLPSPRPPLLTPLGTDASPVTWRLPRTGDAAIAGVLAAYQRYLGTAVRLAERPDPEDRALPAVATDARLLELVRFLGAAARERSSTRGPVTATATVVQAGPTSVTLLGCTDYTRQRTTTSAGATPGGKVAATVVLVRGDAVWKVASSERATGSRCR